MKKRRIFVLLLAAVLLLSACAAPKEAENAGEQEEKSLAGGSFILQKAPVPEKTLWAACVDGVFYTVSEEFSGDIVYHLRRDGTEIYALPGLFYAAAAAPEGIWLLENRYDGENRYVLTLISTGGDTLCSLDLSAAWSGQRFSHFLLYCAGRLVLLTEEAELLGLSPTGERLYTAALPDSQSYPVAAGSGQVYAVQETGGGNLLYQIDGESGELTPAFSCDEGEIFNGSGGAFIGGGRPVHPGGGRRQPPAGDLGGMRSQPRQTVRRGEQRRGRLAHRFRLRSGAALPGGPVGAEAKDCAYPGHVLPGQQTTKHGRRLQLRKRGLCGDCCGLQRRGRAGR